MQDMTRKLRYLLILLFTCVTGAAFAQGQPGAIRGTVTDETGEPLIGAVVEATLGGAVKGGGITDVDGNYLIKPLAAGRYDVRIKFTSYKTSLTTGVIVGPDKTTEVNKKMELNTTEIEQVTVTGYKVPLIDKYAPGGSATKTSEEIENMPTRNVTSVASTAPGVYQAVDGGTLSIQGARGDGTLYIIDGMQVRNPNAVNLAQNTVDQITVNSSGLSAKYGDAIGGVVNITTKGASQDYRAGVLAERSVEGFGHNLWNFTLSGPIYSKRIDSVTKEPKIGFLIGADVIYDKDRRPSYGGNYAVKDEVLDNLKQNPLYSVPTQTGVPAFRNASETVTKDDLYMTKARQNADQFEGRFQARLDFNLADNLTMTAGGNFSYFRNKAYSRSWSLFSPEAMPIDNNYTARGYIRLTQRFSKPSMPGDNIDSETGEEKKAPLISNAYYTLQVDYQKDHFNREHPDHQQDLFKYGYVGKFNTDYQSFYTPGVVDINGVPTPGIVLLTDRLSTRTTFQRSELNPILANYTSQYYNELGNNVPTNVTNIRAQGGLTNGQLPNTTYGLWTNVGHSLSGYSYSDYDQVAVALDASFDLQPGKTKHAIGFGLYYQQRVERQYGTLGANNNGGIWQYMRQLTNQHIGLDTSQPIVIINGQRYTEAEIAAQNISVSPYDTIIYNKSVGDNYSTFAQNLRNKLGLNATDYVDVDEYDPSTFSLDMFSADELLNSGQSFVLYQGYTYTGERQKGQVNFNDFFTKKDANGNFTREIGAFRPNYIAGYVLDNFQYKDILFNVGVRVDRFDANTKMLKDPYSLYAVNTLGDAKNITDGTTGDRKVRNILNGGVDPSNIGDDYVVYVNNNESSSPSIIGYRDGDNWYDPYGRLIEDPTSLKQYSGGRDPQPYLVDNDIRISDSNYNPNSSFTDYKPQVNVMPRISFSFPISDVALFYAHYDVIVQRPKSEVYATAADYYFLTTKLQQIINNPGLKPEKLFDYEVGFQQQISASSAITLSGFYKERKDMITIRPYLYAYPATYYTYGNRDFSTTKGLRVRYDLRRSRTSNLRMDIAYTLQFAEGTGSSRTDGNGSGGANFVGNGLLQGFISANLPNLRYSTPLSYDSRHQIVSTVDYRYGAGEGPQIADKPIFERAGANFIFRARSGEPYTRYRNATANTVQGELNGSRLPWHYNVDLKIDKDFKFDMGKKGKELYVNAYVLINNLTNRRDVLNVDRYTQRPDDNGYLASPIGIQTINNQLIPQSYIDLYTIAQYNPGNINLPRRINIGLSLNLQ